jgi:predicted TIM-barrel fold metal-dependent hydrolase
MTTHSAEPGDGLKIVDAHAHWYDGNANTHRFLDQKDPIYEALVGDYTVLPRNYLEAAYLKDSASCRVEGIVWHEYLSEDPVREVRWVQRLAEDSPIPMALVALVDFLDPGLEERLDIYGSLPNVTAVREHLCWDAKNPLKRLAKRGDLLQDPRWRKGLVHLRERELKCGLEVFSPQLPDLFEVVRLHPDVGFTIAVMGWPLDLSPEGFRQWRKDIELLSQCENVRVSISAIECIFGMNWQLEQVRPWILALIENFGPERCMFGSHLPVDKLSFGFATLYSAYREIVAHFSMDEKDAMFRRVATEWFLSTVIV